VEVGAERFGGCPNLLERLGEDLDVGERVAVGAP
jgi:hypothetical protein